MAPAHPPIPSVQPRRPGLVGDLLRLGDRIRHSSLLSWPVVLFLVLICVPPIALVMLGANPNASTFDHVAWIFAAYFGIAWLLLLGIIIRPEQVTKPMLVLVTAIALATQVPLAITLESDLHASTTGLGPSIYTVGLPEELAKAIPVLAVALIYWRRRNLTPRDYLFLGAVSGLVFGASEVVHYFTVNGVEEFYLTIQSAIPPIEQLLATGHSASTSLFAVLIGPVRFFTLDFVWRFLTDPISHACWSGLTGYFIGLAVTRRHKWYAVAWIGLAAAAVLHGLNDWGRVNGQPLWIVVVAVSGILFLGFARAGSGGTPQPAGDALPPTFRLHGTPARHAPVSPDGQPAQPPPGYSPATPDGHPKPGAVSGSRSSRPWWEH
jgi:RsiW-degrading membrane proteinase PrsW (M82 family)